MTPAPNPLPHFEAADGKIRVLKSDLERLALKPDEITMLGEFTLARGGTPYQFWFDDVVIVRKLLRMA